MSRNTAQRPLASLLAHSTKAIDVLPHLHQHALDVTGGVCSLLFRYNPRNESLQATSGFGLDTLRSDPWLPGDREAAIVADAFAKGSPLLVSDAADETPDLAARLSTRSALMVPLIGRGMRVGVLAIGFSSPPPPSSVEDTGMQAADAFIAALELFTLRQAEEMQRDVRELLD